ncbi:hypothetical protein I553_10711 [Mycobacterium xenopi 4042]|uniref:Uncharacterized protein n=1 Tax=Mycobacterium xenopi 4042 TaxID=1299334 RepID=X8DAN2_MYCXE|nr:hypothetical protein I553_10711 [Mycobacterium xenopi 4042]
MVGDHLPVRPRLFAARPVCGRIPCGRPLLLQRGQRAGQRGADRVWPLSVDIAGVSGGVCAAAIALRAPGLPVVRAPIAMAGDILRSVRPL